jgi:hypothetical protein
MGDECSMGGGAAEAGGASRRCRCGETRCRRAGWVTAGRTRAGRHRRRNCTDGPQVVGSRGPPCAEMVRSRADASVGVAAAGCRGPQAAVRLGRDRAGNPASRPSAARCGRGPRTFGSCRRTSTSDGRHGADFLGRGGGLGQARRPAAVVGMPMRRCMPADVPPRSAPRRPVMDRLMPAASMTPPKTSCDPENPLHGAGNLFPGIRQSSVEKRYFRKTSGFATDGGNVACRSGRFRERPHPGLRHPPPAAGRR